MIVSTCDMDSVTLDLGDDVIKLKSSSMALKYSVKESGNTSFTLSKEHLFDSCYE